MSIKDIFPLSNQLTNYSSTLFKNDLAAGLTVGVMLIPQGMAYAMIAGLPPIFGLYASTIPLILYAIFGTSRQLAVGPVAMVSLLTAAGIGAIAKGGTETYILLAITLAFMVGLLQFLLGVFRLGFLVNFLSHPVISGFTSAAALIIGLKHLLGISIPNSHHVHEIIGNAISQFSAINWITFAIGIMGIFIIKVLKKWAKAIPRQLAAVVFGILLVWAFELTEQGVKIVGTIPSGLPSFSLPSVSWEHWEELLLIAITIALVSFMESIAVAKAIQSKHRNYKVIPNQELRALGIANIGGAFFQSYPVTGGFSRTAVNDQAGAKTGVSSIISAVLIILTLLFLTPLFYYLPNAILAAVIMVAVFGLIDFQEAHHLWKSNRTDFWMLFATFLSTLLLGIELGIGIGVVLSLAMVIYQSTRPHIAILGQVPETTFYRNIERFPNVKEREDVLIFRFDAPLYFANIQHFKDSLETEINRKRATLEAIILPANTIYNMDSSAIHTLKEILEDCKSRHIQLLFTGVRGPVRDALKKGHLIQKIGEQNFFMNIQQAVNYLDEKHPTATKTDFANYTLQTN
jgi:SulP family sulfate permease